MINLNIKPIIKNSYNIEKKQPSYSAFLIERDDKILPISVNTAGADILRMCNGKNEISDIIHSLMDKNDVKFDTEKKFVIEFLEDMHKNNVIDLNDSFNQIENIQYGSRDYWTPEKISVEITNANPLKRKHFFNSPNSGENTNYLSEDVFYNILFDMKNMDIENLRITGGEPLLHKDFFIFLNKAIELGMKCHVFTSGYICNDDIVSSFRKIADSKKITLKVSIDGLEDYHDNFKGVKGAYKKSMNFIDTMVEMGIPVNVTCCINNQSYSEIKSLTKLLKDKGVEVFRLNPITSSGKVSNKAAYFNCMQINEIVSKLKEEFEDSYFKITKHETDAKNNGSIGLKNCGLGQTQLKIDSFGKVYPCAMSNFEIGNICEETIKSIQMRNSKIFEKIVPQDIDACGECSQVSSTCIIQDLIVNETSLKPSNGYFNQMKLINTIKCINKLKVIKS